jgi:hypothetical protein
MAPTRTRMTILMINLDLAQQVPVLLHRQPPPGLPQHHLHHHLLLLQRRRLPLH